VPRGNCVCPATGGEPHDEHVCLGPMRSLPSIGTLRSPHPHSSGPDSFRPTAASCHRSSPTNTFVSGVGPMRSLPSIFAPCDPPALTRLDFLPNRLAHAFVHHIRWRNSFAQSNCTYFVILFCAKFGCVVPNTSSFLFV